MTVEIKKLEFDHPGLKTGWERLHAHSADSSVVQGWDWADCWWRTYGGDRTSWVLGAYRDGELVGIAPLAKNLNPTRYFGFLGLQTIWFVGSGRTKARGVLSEYLDFIVRDGSKDECARALLGYLAGDTGWDEIILDNISAESGTVALLERYARDYGLKYEVVDKTPTILIKLPASWDEYLQSISSNLRYRINRGRKEFTSHGGEYHLVENEAQLSGAMADLEKLHQHRWEGKGQDGAFASQHWKSFHTLLVPRLFDKGMVKLSFLKLDGQAVAANYNFACNGKIHFFQSGMIPHENKHIRLGLILHSYCIEEAIREGYKEYDFLKISSSGPGYKEMWGNYSRDLLTIRITRKTIKEYAYMLSSNIKKHLKKILAS
ncbi:MAG: GNAT family N-acetyltransferase [Sedimentisphaerales bacterium]|nr:GNAT family N-acetyltransferase [Sedimentisphaerales bacterium]